jgi:hypothetical protein
LRSSYVEKYLGTFGVYGNLQFFLSLYHLLDLLFGIQLYN